MKKLMVLGLLCCGMLAASAHSWAAESARMEIDVPAGSTVLVLDRLEDRDINVAEVFECQCGCPAFPQSWNYATGFSKMNACANARAGMRMTCIPVACQ